MRCFRFVTFLAIAAACTLSLAQVNRCKDPSGKTTYSDRPCDMGQTGAMIEHRKSNQEIDQERMQASEANEREYRQRLAEQHLQMRERAGAPASQAPVQQDRSSSYECKQAQRDHETIASIRTGTPEEHRNRINASTVKVNAACNLQTEMIQPPPRIVAPSYQGPAMFTRCDAGFCYDNQGGVYRRNGPNFMTGPNGRACQRVGKSWNCNPG